MRKGNRYLRRVLTQSAWSITHKKDCFLTSLFWRVAARGGRKKAAMAVANRMLTIAWHIINNDGTRYREIGGDHHDRLHPQRSARRLMRRLEQIGFEVSVKPKSAERAPVPESVTPSPSTVGRRSRGSRTTVPLPSTSHKKPEVKPADPSICRRCARWGIACVHVRNARPSSLALTQPTESVT